MLRNRLSEAIEALNNGRVVVYPTDTLYAFGVNIYDDNAVMKVFKIKKRPYDIPIPVAVPNINEMEKIAFVNHTTIVLAKHFLPGSLTLVLDKKNIVPDIVTSGLKKIAIRIPNNKIALDLLANSGPLTVTSANIHGKKTSYVINDLKIQFSDRISAYIENGRLDKNPSTIVDLTSQKPLIVRKGPIKKDDILDAIKNG